MPPSATAAITKRSGGSFRIRDFRVQVAGGVRSVGAYRRLRDAGARRVVFGTAALETPEVVEEAIRRDPAGWRWPSMYAGAGSAAAAGWRPPPGNRAKPPPGGGAKPPRCRPRRRRGSGAGAAPPRSSTPVSSATGRWRGRTRRGRSGSPALPGVPTIVAGGVGDLSHLRELRAAAAPGEPGSGGEGRRGRAGRGDPRPGALRKALHPARSAGGARRTGPDRGGRRDRRG